MNFFHSLHNFPCPAQHICCTPYRSYSSSASKLELFLKLMETSLSFSVFSCYNNISNYFYFYSYYYYSYIFYNFHNL
ncbi:hypothetical protein CLS_09950 [[Clostridium] cf. saccharolyticum K10]|nr:hypothetical protein CLS_09950 [[Clostridium] cf. saccharolyticum K10]